MLLRWSHSFHWASPFFTGTNCSWQSNISQNVKGLAQMRSDLINSWDLSICRQTPCLLVQQGCLPSPLCPPPPFAASFHPWVARSLLWGSLCLCAFSLQTNGPFCRGPRNVLRGCWFIPPPRPISRTSLTGFWLNDSTSGSLTIALIAGHNTIDLTRGYKKCLLFVPSNLNKSVLHFTLRQYPQWRPPTFLARTT